jgi:predicted TIM-barrel fold metal-dependent hydrolase
MPSGWREYVAANMPAEWRESIRTGSSPRPSALAPNPLTPRNAYPRPGGDKLASAYPDGGPAGSSYELVRDQHLDAHGIGRAVLCHDTALMAPALPHTRLGTEIIRAVNDWTVREWLERDDRLFGAILVPNQLPDVAAAEVRRLGANERMVAVIMGANGLGKPFGHAAYHRIYEAAAELELPIILHLAAGDVLDSLSPSTAAGHASTYSDHRALVPQAAMLHVVSLISQGVFERYPLLRVLLVGAGATWVPPFLWRFDTNYQGIRLEAPWLKRLPSEYFREFFRVATYPFSPAPSPEQLVRYYEAFGGFDDLLCFGSGYPNWDTATPAQVTETLPDDWWQKISHTNSLDLFRWR